MRILLAQLVTSFKRTQNAQVLLRSRLFIKSTMNQDLTKMQTEQGLS